MKLTKEALLQAGWEERRDFYTRKNGIIYVRYATGNLAYAVASCFDPSTESWAEVRSKFRPFTSEDDYPRAAAEALDSVGKRKLSNGKRVCTWALSTKVLGGVTIQRCLSSDHAALCEVSDPLYLFMEQIKRELWITRGYGIDSWNKRAPIVWLVSDSDMRRDLCLDSEGWKNRPEQPF